MNTFRLTQEQISMKKHTEMKEMGGWVLGLIIGGIIIALGYVTGLSRYLILLIAIIVLFAFHIRKGRMG